MNSAKGSLQLSGHVSRPHGSNIMRPSVCKRVVIIVLLKLFMLRSTSDWSVPNVLGIVQADPSTAASVAFGLVGISACAF